MIQCKYSVYLLKSTVSNRTYIGYTNKAVSLRLRKHNGELSGGSKKTSIGRPWEIVLYVTGFKYEKTALQYEFVAQHPPKRLRNKGPGIANKIRILKALLKQERICSTSPLNSKLKLAVFFYSPKAAMLWNSY